MTVNATPSNVTYAGDGVSTAFPLPFYVQKAGDVFAASTSAGAPDGTTLVLGTDYTIQNAGVQSGAQLTLAHPLAVGTQLYADRSNIVVDQQSDYVQNDKFPAATNENALDKLTMILQLFRQILGSGNAALARVLTLGRFDTNGAGSYRANNNRIQDLADPKADQDAVNQRSMFSFVTTYVDKAIAGVAGGFGNFLQAGFGAVYRTFQDKMRDTVSAKDFGLVGDGTDETVAMQRALDASTGKRLILDQAKVYGITTVNIPDDVTITANGSNFNKVAASSTYAITGGLRLSADRLWLTTVGGTNDTGINLNGGSMKIGEIRVESAFTDSGTTGSLINGVLIGPATGSVARDRIGAIYVSQFCRPVVFRNVRKANVGLIQIDGFKRGVYVQDCQDCDFGDAAITGLAPSSIGEPGDNGLLIESTVAGGTANIRVGSWYVEDSGEHAFRLGGILPIRGFSADNLHALRPGSGSASTGGSGFKVLGSSTNSYHYNVFVDNLLVEDGASKGGNFCGIQLGLVSGCQINNAIVRPRNNTYSTYNGISILSGDNISINNPIVRGTESYAARLYTAVSAGFTDGTRDTVISGGILEMTGTANVAAVKFEGNGADTDAPIVRSGLKGVTIFGGQRAVDAAPVTGAGAYTDCFLDFTYQRSAGAGAILQGTDAFLVDFTLKDISVNDATPAANGSTQRSTNGVDNRRHVKSAGGWGALSSTVVITLADDTAKSWTPPSGNGWYFVSTPGLTYYGQAWIRSSTAGAVKIAGGANFATATTALTGTTGTDGNITLSTAGGLIYIENRSGNSQVITVTLLG